MVGLKHLVAMNGNIFELSKDFYEKAARRVRLEQAEQTLF